MIAAPPPSGRSPFDLLVDEWAAAIEADPCKTRHLAHGLGAALATDQRLIQSSRAVGRELVAIAGTAKDALTQTMYVLRTFGQAAFGLDGPAGNNGCPRRQRVNVTLRARPTANGIEIDGLTVTAKKGSRVVVTCSRGCRRQSKRARGKVGFPGLRGTMLSAGARLDIRVTKKGYFGEFARYTVLPGNFKKIERCTNPGSRKLRRRCG